MEAKILSCIFFPISALNNLDEGNAEKVVIMPPYLEQIYVQNGQLLMLFESGSKAYARDQIMIVDRILSANINALLGVKMIKKISFWVRLAGWSGLISGSSVLVLYQYTHNIMFLINLITIILFSAYALATANDKGGQILIGFYELF